MFDGGDCGVFKRIPKVTPFLEKMSEILNNLSFAYIFEFW